MIGEDGYYSTLTNERIINKLVEKSKNYYLRDKVELVDFVVGEYKFKVLLEAYLPSTRLIILGGGYIAQALVKISQGLNLDLIVIDDRPSFANKELFPQAKEVICNDFKIALEQLRIYSEDFVVIATRGHQHDLNCLKYILPKDTAYLGMISSKRRFKKVTEQLLKEGYSQERLSQIYSPIGQV